MTVREPTRLPAGDRGASGQPERREIFPSALPHCRCARRGRVAELPFGREECVRAILLKPVVGHNLAQLEACVAKQIDDDMLRQYMHFHLLVTELQIIYRAEAVTAPVRDGLEQASYSETAQHARKDFLLNRWTAVLERDEGYEDIDA